MLLDFVCGFGLESPTHVSGLSPFSIKLYLACSFLSKEKKCFFLFVRCVCQTRFKVVFGIINAQLFFLVMFVFLLFMLLQNRP